MDQSVPSARRVSASSLTVPWSSGWRRPEEIGGGHNTQQQLKAEVYPCGLQVVKMCWELPGILPTRYDMIYSSSLSFTNNTNDTMVITGIHTSSLTNDTNNTIARSIEKIRSIENATTDGFIPTSPYSPPPVTNNHNRYVGGGLYSPQMMMMNQYYNQHPQQTTYYHNPYSNSNPQGNNNGPSW